MLKFTHGFFFSKFIYDGPVLITKFVGNFKMQIELTVSKSVLASPFDLNLFIVCDLKFVES